MENSKWTISDRVYLGLRGSIMSLKLKPGDAIDINAISGNLGVSRSPVRDALLKLEKEGLVDLMPQKGTIVSRIDFSRVHEERFLRESLEEKTLELFIDMYTDTDICRLADALDRQKKSLSAGDYTGFLDYDDEYHRIFFEAADKKMCWSIIQSMSGHYRRVRLLVLSMAGLPADKYAQHEELFECIKKRNREESLRLLREHLSRLIIEEQDLLSEFPDYFTNRNSGGTFF